MPKGCRPPTRTRACARCRSASRRCSPPAWTDRPPSANWSDASNARTSSSTSRPATTCATASARSMRFVTRSATDRFLRIQLNADYNNHTLVALLGHELQHVVEVADHAEVQSPDDLREFYRRTGVRTGPDSFDSEEARHAGYLVRDEIIQEARRPAHGARRQPRRATPARRQLDSPPTTIPAPARAESSPGLSQEIRRSRALTGGQEFRRLAVSKKTGDQEFKSSNRRPGVQEACGFQEDRRPGVQELKQEARSSGGLRFPRRQETRSSRAQTGGQEFRRLAVSKKTGDREFKSSNRRPGVQEACGFQEDRRPGVQELKQEARSSEGLRFPRRQETRSSRAQTGGQEFRRLAVSKKTGDQEFKRLTGVPRI